MHDPNNFLKQVFLFIFLVCPYVVVLGYIVVSNGCNPMDLYNGIPGQHQSTIDVSVTSWLGDMGVYSVDVPTSQLNEYLTNNHDTWISYYQVGNQYEAICERLSIEREEEHVTILFKGFSINNPVDRVHMRFNFDCPDGIWAHYLSSLPGVVEESNIVIKIIQ